MKLIIDIALTIGLLQVVTCADLRNLTNSPHINSNIENVESYRIISRSEWIAQPPNEDLFKFENKIENVIITQTATESCSTQASCTFQTRFIQMFHMESRGFDDIAYNFLIGGNGAIYEGRGWDFIGAHTKGFNKDSLGIAFIGTFSRREPPQQQLNAAKFLIDKGLQLGKLATSYKLYGQRQLINTESPGRALFMEIQKWSHFTEYLNSTSIVQDNNKYSIDFVSRNKWLAREPTANLDNLQIPVKKVIIAHTASPECQTQIECSPKVRSMQRYHIDEKGYNDISYNFLIGGDGSVYEGRGWNKIGAHTKGYNEDSICIAFIGNFMTVQPTDEQLNSAKLLINDGIAFGDLTYDYILYGQRQLVATLSPGDKLFNEISKWPNFLKLTKE